MNGEKSNKERFWPPKGMTVDGQALNGPNDPPSTDSPKIPSPSDSKSKSIEVQRATARLIAEFCKKRMTFESERKRVEKWIIDKIA